MIDWDEARRLVEVHAGVIVTSNRFLMNMTSPYLFLACVEDNIVGDRIDWPSVERDYAASTKERE